MQAAVAQWCSERRLYGTLLVAREGVNGTVAGLLEHVEALLDRLREVPGLGSLRARYHTTDRIPFMRMKVRSKPEIVTLGVTEVDPTACTGERVEPEAWNALLDDASTIVVDVRNDYEVRVGSFEGAVDPAIRRFRDFPGWVEAHRDTLRERKVAMFCTGGIRCEKASSLMLARGFGQVYQLEGGILHYLQRVSPERSRWRGECFVFDERVAVAHDGRPGHTTVCYGCKEPLSPQDRTSPEYEYGVACPRCHARTTEVDRRRRRERVRQERLASARGGHHLGRPRLV